MADMTNVVMTEKDINKVSSAQKVTKFLVQFGLYFFLGVMAFIVLFPFYWMLISSFKTVTEYNWLTPSFYPHTPTVKGYVQAFKMANLANLFVNTLYVGIISTILSLIITVLSAFAFARLEFKGKNLLFAFLLATMMIPGELFTVTNFQTIMKWDWRNTYKVLLQ